MPIIREANNVEVSVLGSVCLQWGKKIIIRISEWKGEMREGGKKRVRKRWPEKQVKLKIVLYWNNVEVSVLDSVCLQWGKIFTFISRDEGGRKEERGMSREQVKLKLGGRMTYHIIFTLICPVAKHWKREGDKRRDRLYWNLVTCL